MTKEEHIRTLMHAAEKREAVDYYGQNACVTEYSIRQELVGWTYRFHIIVFSKYGAVGNYSNSIEIFSESFVDNRSE